MKTKIALKFSIIMFAAASLLLGCAEGDKFDYNRNAILFAGTEVSPVVKFTVDRAPASYKLSAISTRKVSEDISLMYSLDKAALEAYNKKNGTQYVVIPQQHVTITAGTGEPKPISEGVTATIKSGSAATNAPATISISSTELLQDGVTYVIPMTMTVTKGNIEILDDSKTIFIRLSRVVNFSSLNMDKSPSVDQSLYSNFIFEDNKKRTLGAFTYEFKCLIKAWNPSSSDRISRLMSFGSKDGKNASMIRFSENGYPQNSVQWVTPAGGIVPSNTFDFNNWYHFSLVYTGTTFILYIDGVKVGDLEWPAANRQSIDFQLIELGMSWGNYRTRQRFNGRLADVRVWEKALTVGQIRAGICGVERASEGLVAWWQFAEPSGDIFVDSTPNGYDMDWSKSVRERRENTSLTPCDAHLYIERIKDDINKCSN